MKYKYLDQAITVFHVVFIIFAIGMFFAPEITAAVSIILICVIFTIGATLVENEEESRGIN